VSILIHEEFENCPSLFKLKKSEIYLYLFQYKELDEIFNELYQMKPLSALKNANETKE
jgi:hypothetical protein